MSSEMANKPNFGTEWSGTGRTDQRSVWSWWSASHSSLVQLSFLLGHQNPLSLSLSLSLAASQPLLMSSRQVVRFTASCSHAEVSMLKDFREIFSVSLKRFHWPPTDRFPLESSPYGSGFGMLSSAFIFVDVTKVNKMFHILTQKFRTYNSYFMILKMLLLCCVQLILVSLCGRYYNMI